MISGPHWYSRGLRSLRKALAVAFMSPVMIHTRDSFAHRRSCGHIVIACFELLNWLYSKGDYVLEREAFSRCSKEAELDKDPAQKAEGFPTTGGVLAVGSARKDFGEQDTMGWCSLRRCILLVKIAIWEQGLRIVYGIHTHTPYRRNSSILHSNMDASIGFSQDLLLNLQSH